MRVANDGGDGCQRALVASLVIAFTVACGSASPTESTSTESVSTGTGTASPVAALPSECAAGELGYSRIDRPRPDGVVEDTGDRALVLAASEGFALPPDVTFTITDGPRVDGGRIVLAGELVNASAEPRDVFLTEAGAPYFYATLTTDAATGTSLVRRPAPPAGPRPPALFPEPHRFTLAPGVHWPFELAVHPECWVLTPAQTVTVHWWLAVSGHDLQGDVPVLVP